MCKGNHGIEEERVVDRLNEIYAPIKYCFERDIPPEIVTEIIEEKVLNDSLEVKLVANEETTS